MIDKLLLPGQVENWIVIIDLNKSSILDLPLMVFYIILESKENYVNDIMQF